MRFFLTAAVCALSVMGSQAVAEGQYVSVSGGNVGEVDFSYEDVFGSDYQSDFKSGRQFLAAYGRSYGKTRIEFALTQRSQDISKAVRMSGGNTSINTLNGEVKAVIADVNAYYDFPVEGRFKPYVGAGVGVANLSINDGFLDDSASVLNIQAMAGVNIQLSKAFDLFAEARVQRLGSFTIETVSGSQTNETDISLNNSGIAGGVRFKF